MPNTAVPRQSLGLSAQQIAFFHDNGYLGPLTLCSEEEMAEFRQMVEGDVLQTDGANPKNRLQCRHLDRRWVFDMANRPTVIDKMASLYGDDLVLWATYFFNKEPGGAEIPWHQDLGYWPLEPLINISAWIAVDEATQENSCVNLIPGSHRGVYPMVQSPDGMAFSQMTDMRYVDVSKARPIELKPGEYFLFNEKTLHQSKRNNSKKRRMGFTMRVTLPIVRVTHDQPPLFPGHANMLMRGEDRMGFNRMAKPPCA
jgi:ectoine hydroxylase-related dioxygenase (phytanoyl-CoA dioxygenase family)